MSNFVEMSFIIIVSCMSTPSIPNATCW